jgi:hypothetical protein
MCRARALDVSISAGRSLDLDVHCRRWLKDRKVLLVDDARHTEALGTRHSLFFVRSAPGSLNWITTSSLKIEGARVGAASKKKISAFLATDATGTILLGYRRPVQFFWGGDRPLLHVIIAVSDANIDIARLLTLH